MEGAEFLNFKKCGIERLVVGPLDVNCYLVWDKSSRDAVLIDPGGDASEIEKEVRKEGLRVRYIVNTHGHFDHVGGNAQLKDSLGAKVAIHKSDSELLENVAHQGSSFGFDSPASPPADIFLEDGTLLKAGDIILRVIYTPGHTEGGISVYIKSEGIIFTGDSLFKDSIGRTDLPGGSFEKLADSIKKILSLGDGVVVLSGHGPKTTVGEEKRGNPFVIEII